MSRLVRLCVLLALLTAVVAAIGGWVGVRIGLHQVQAHAGLDKLIHREMGLSPDQDRSIAILEARYAARRRAFEAEMRAANVDLSDAISSEHAYGSRAQHAVARFHGAMGALQEETIRHVLAMRGVMTPIQARRFDALVATALKPSAT